MSEKKILVGNVKLAERSVVADRYRLASLKLEAELKKALLAMTKRATRAEERVRELEKALAEAGLTCLNCGKEAVADYIFVQMNDGRCGRLCAMCKPKKER